NLLAAGIIRKPSILKIYLKYKDKIKAKHILLVLKEAKEKYPSIKILLINIFFLGRFCIIDKDLGF
ncbi:hypothetical protein F5883DRAFT_422575, partial [Diaporthe sp. PMI_573]